MARAWWQDEDDEYCSCGMALAFHDDGECPSSEQRSELRSRTSSSGLDYYSIAMETGD